MADQPIKVLLIEDNPADARLVERYLGDQQDGSIFELEWIDRAIEGSERLHKGGHDVVLLDLSLPDSHGYETFERMVAVAGATPIVVMTGEDDDRQALRAVREGAQDYLVKDRVDADILVRSIRYAVERGRIEEALRVSEERYALAVTGANDGVWDWNLTSGEVYFSERWREILGWDSDAEGHTSDDWLSRLHPSDRKAVERAIRDHLDDRSDYLEIEHRLQIKDGSYRWFLARGVAVRGEDGAATRMAGSLTDIHRRKLTEEQLEHDALHDPLTQLPNSTLFKDRLGLAIAQAKRRSGYLFAVLFFDLDRFKIINDSLGHALGDRLLRAISRRLLSFLRPGDSVARLGGDEFAILAADIEDSSDATRIAERINEELSHPFDLGGHEVFTTASIGIALSSTGYEHPEEVLRDADTAMYRAKSLGKAQHAVFDEAMHHRAVALLRLENDLRRAVEREEFRVYYQPIVSLGSGRLEGLEALVRWQHPDRGLLMPREFIAVAEETGLIVPIGWCVLREACRQMLDWRAGVSACRDLALSVNLSNRQFRQPDLVLRLRTILEETSFPPEALRLEITEGLIMDETELAIDKLAQLRGLGVQLHLDDFGTGYSSLSYLHRLPTHTVKIDRSFVSHMEEGNGEAEIVETIVSLARHLGMEVAAEGLETTGQFHRLRQLDCEYGQGFYFSKPLGADDTKRLLSSNPRW
jgi:diguanylate cyclase (GGDEF)-like protein/PAS domain S-box-containing protein